MPCHHVGKKTNDQGKGLNKYTQELYRHKDQFNTKGHTGRIENMTPVMAVGTEQYHYKRNQTQYSRKGNITCYVGRARYQAKNIINENEKENCQQVGQVFFVFMTQVGFCHFISYKSDYRLEQTLRTFRRRSNTYS